jgi:hypothetical protein
LSETFLRVEDEKVGFSAELKFSLVCRKRLFGKIKGSGGGS